MPKNHRFRHSFTLANIEPEKKFTRKKEPCSLPPRHELESFLFRPEASIEFVCGSRGAALRNDARAAERSRANSESVRGAAFGAFATKSFALARFHQRQ